MRMTRIVSRTPKLHWRSVVLSVLLFLLFATPSLGQDWRYVEIFGLRLGATNPLDIKNSLTRQGYDVHISKDLTDERISSIEIAFEPIKTDYMEFNNFYCSFFTGSLYSARWTGRLPPNEDSAARLTKLIRYLSESFGEYEFESDSFEKLELDAASLKKIVSGEHSMFLTWRIEAPRVELSKRVELALSNLLFVFLPDTLDVKVRYVWPELEARALGR